VSIFADTDQRQADEIAQGELAQAKPTGFMENAAAAWKEFNTNDALGALDSRRRSAYDERIKQVQALTGEKLENPLPIPRNRIGLEDPISLVYNMFANDDGAAEIQRMNEHEQKISALRERLGPDDRGQLLTQQQISDKLKAESKQAERQAADIGSRATVGGMVLPCMSCANTNPDPSRYGVADRPHTRRFGLPSRMSAMMRCTVGVIRWHSSTMTPANSPPRRLAWVLNVPSVAKMTRPRRLLLMLALYMEYGTPQGLNLSEFWDTSSALGARHRTFLPDRPCSVSASMAMMTLLPAPVAASMTHGVVVDFHHWITASWAFF